MNFLQDVWLRVVTHTHTQTAVEVIQETIPEYKSKFAPETRPKLPQKEFSSSIHSDFFGVKLAVGLAQELIEGSMVRPLRDPLMNGVQYTWTPINGRK